MRLLLDTNAFLGFVLDEPNLGKRAREVIGDAANDVEVSPAILTTLPFHHRDPFDRLLVAQAMVEDIPLFSNDAALEAYPIERIW